MRYVDPDGREIENAEKTLMKTASSNLGKSDVKISSEGCVLTTYTRMASAILGQEISLDNANKIAIKNNLYTGEKDKENLLSPESGSKLINAILIENGETEKSVSFEGSFSNQEALDKYKAASSSEDKYFASVRVKTENENGDKYEHTMNIDANAYKENACGGANLLVNDTSGVRTQLIDDTSGRKNTF